MLDLVRAFGLSDAGHDFDASPLGPITYMSAPVVTHGTFVLEMRQLSTVR